MANDVTWLMATVHQEESLMLANHLSVKATPGEVGVILVCK